ncbi:MAG: peptidylprolyl isomerase [Sulfurimonas sp. RIFCSPHIGHO2_12_FULL_36_9]|uniref:peptidylprolyl isomerase n=1 Tax=Sulfurimonas sp. RIFCSPLOWO2_12_36_12 TaxID=1802253 RepID=UPI0008C83E98|nr:peptidylprolyl isomerase [Sulfurimonas sp. RIFCSPLOWO2_12_36_12]OHD98746.1 MAG: peptidylprolyl isomerase [Sulfurimonas sp. RIFCSPHIGHO2_12_FULL_36_9]OHE02017.1 MAG: peptidylprolyl isomerase [Sulfurimonas sp. RIFCSPLOWO2_12_36_12]OHE07161.1 MAG: peptidylprolyl isomerase [Sulfurimonas sp. RIFCSPLOWO2_12_FULL_36_74]
MYKIFLSLFFGVVLNAELISGVSVVVKGEAITLYDVKEEMRISNVDAAAATDNLIRKKLEEAEINEKKISVTSTEVYDDIKKVAAANKMSIDEFYDAVRESSGLSSAEFKEKTKEKILSQKLYSAIAYSSVEAPTEDEIKEYYGLHKEDFLRPTAFKATVYTSKNRDILQKKISTPVFNSNEIKIEEQVFPYDRVSPELAQLLEKAQINSFTPIIVDNKGSFVSFYLKEVQKPSKSAFDDVKEQIANLIMGQKREQVLGDYFARLRGNADIQIIRKAE